MMANKIYGIKIVLFRSQFELKETELSNAEHFTLFKMIVNELYDFVTYNTHTFLRPLTLKLTF